VTANGDAARRLVGRTIRRVVLRAYRDGRGGWAAHPYFVLDDGSRLVLQARETETETGIDLILHE
jgi:hypothetical protein